MTRDDDVEPLHAERGELGGDLLLVGAAIDEHRHAGRRRDERRVALPDVEEPHGERVGRSDRGRRVPHEQRQ